MRKSLLSWSCRWLSSGSLGIKWYFLMALFCDLVDHSSISGPELSPEVGALQMYSGACMLLIDTVVAADTWVFSSKHMGPV